MIESLLNLRPSRSALVLLAIVSGVATALILADALGASPVQQAVLAAARARSLAGQREIVLAEAALRTRAQASPAPASVDPSPSAGQSGGGGDAAGASAAAPTAAGPSDTGSGTPAASPGAPTSPSSSAPAATPTATVSHVFEIVLSSTGYGATFASGSAMPYLRSLVARGTELSHFRSLGHGSLADELALVSGQPPNADTSAGCTTYAEFPSNAAPNAAGVLDAPGCVYPETVLTLGDQVSSAGHLWRAYIGGMGAQACLHPNSNAADGTVLTGAGPTYDTRHNPFIYFHSLLDLGDCSTGDLDLGKLSGALARRAHAPAYVFIAPGACEDAAQEAVTPAPADPTGSTSSTTSTASSTAGPASTAATTTASASTNPAPVGAASPGCPAGEPSGPAAEDAFLKAWVPKILASPGYRDQGALVIAFTAARTPTHPIRTGALILTAHRAGRRAVATEADPYALLRATESALGLTPLGEAKGATNALAALF